MRKMTILAEDQVYDFIMYVKDWHRESSAGEREIHHQ